MRLRPTPAHLRLAAFGAVGLGLWLVVPTIAGAVLGNVTAADVKDLGTGLGAMLTAVGGVFLWRTAAGGKPLAAGSTGAPAPGGSSVGGLTALADRINEMEASQGIIKAELDEVRDTLRDVEDRWLAWGDTVLDLAGRIVGSLPAPEQRPFQAEIDAAKRSRPRRRKPLTEEIAA